MRLTGACTKRTTLLSLGLLVHEVLVVYFSDLMFKLGKELKHGRLLAQVVISPRSLLFVLEFID